MKIKCEYCGSYISDTDERCPNCGAVNEHLVRSGNGVPQTVEELRAFCEAHQLPLEKMRFFIGEDYQQPKAFGIYQDASGDYVVYKNKADGSRVIRYQGKDEAYAVNELYQKMKSEVQLRKGAPSSSENGSHPGDQKDPTPGSKWVPWAILAGVALVILVVFLLMPRGPQSGYYLYHGNYYYYQDNSWFCYNGDWYDVSSVDDALDENAENYWRGNGYQYGVEAFENSPYYESTNSNHDSWNFGNTDWDNDWDVGDWDSDYDSWDSGDTNWDSDW